MRMLEPANKTKEAAIWVTANMRKRRLVLPVIRRLLLESVIPLERFGGRQPRNISQQYGSHHR